MSEHQTPTPVLPYTQSTQIKVKAYGLLPLTKQVYLLLQFAVLGLGIALYIWFTFNPPAWVKNNTFADWFVPGILVALVCEGIETILMLRRFSARERER